MTTKFAAFFRFVFLYSAATSRFLLLMRTGSCIDSFATLLPRSWVGPEVVCDLEFCEGAAGAMLEDTTLNLEHVERHHQGLVERSRKVISRAHHQQAVGCRCWLPLYLQAV